MIYIAGQRFIQCKHLLLDIPVSEISNFEEIDSVDKAVEKLRNTSRNMRRAKILPEVEFWGHCSNLQTWYEHSYDTRILHSNLAFALLGKLAEVGDLLAKKKFKAELIERYESGTDRTREFIVRSGALKYFSLEERLNLLLNTEDFIALTELAEEIWVESDPYTLVEALIIEEIVQLKERKVIKLDLSGSDLELEEFPKSALRLKNLEVLYMGSNYIKEIPTEINKLSSLREFSIGSNEISQIPQSICKITSIEILRLGGNKIQALPERIGDLKHLRTLSLSSNEITDLPESFFDLKSLETLLLGSNRLEHIPRSFCKLISLKWLNLSNNSLKKLPECLLNHHSLEHLDVSKNPFTDNQELIEKIKKLGIRTRI